MVIALEIVKFDQSCRQRMFLAESPQVAFLDCYATFPLQHAHVARQADRLRSQVFDRLKVHSGEPSHQFSGQSHTADNGARECLEYLNELDSPYGSPLQSNRFTITLFLRAVRPPSSHPRSSTSREAHECDLFDASCIEVISVVLIQRSACEVLECVGFFFAHDVPRALRGEVVREKRIQILSQESVDFVIRRVRFVRRAEYLTADELQLRRCDDVSGL